MQSKKIFKIFFVFYGAFRCSKADVTIEKSTPKQKSGGILGRITPNENGMEFLKQNAKKSDVIALSSGVQYKIERGGMGMFHPAPHSLCRIHYEGHSRNGTQFDSSYARDRIIKTRPDHLVKGLEEVMQLMVEGDLWEIFVPPELGYSAYHSSTHDGLDHSDVTIFKVWLVEIIGEKVEAIDRCDVVTLIGCSDDLKKYIQNSMIRYRSVERMKIQLDKLRKKMHRGPASTELKHDLHNKIHILDLLIKHRESGGTIPDFSSDEF